MSINIEDITVGTLVVINLPIRQPVRFRTACMGTVNRNEGGEYDNGDGKFIIRWVGGHLESFVRDEIAGHLCVVPVVCTNFK